MALNTQWPTLDPFLFCAHHLDHYPAGDGKLGPASSLDGRQIGQDFAGVDGWNMYHGAAVPGFPQHPHRGFETVTYVRQGWCDHSDSLGARARFGEGDVQWLTAGSGIVHSEMFPLLSVEEPNPLHLFQIWLNLPAANKMVTPSYSMLWADDIPTVAVSEGVEVTLITGALNENRPPEPPPDSWAAKPDSDVAIWHVRLGPDSVWELPAGLAGIGRVLYHFDGDGMSIDGEAIDVDTAAVLDSERSVVLKALSSAECLILQGRPIGEPVAQHGPFVMNTAEEIEQAFQDYQRTGFGGWPWPAEDPVHGPEKKRFEAKQHSCG
jgi:redox-sensitive bicupin YhaK (pirin superfamily)